MKRLSKDSKIDLFADFFISIINFFTQNKSNWLNASYISNKKPEPL
nr:MAG TPA: hypothetical protein [Caudoviricetes sp.]